MVGGMFATQNKLGYWSVTRPFLLAKGRQRQTTDQDGKDKTGYDIYATGRTHSPDHGSRCDSCDSTVTPRLVSAANPTPT